MKSRVIGRAALIVLAASVMEAAVVRAQEGAPFLWVLPGSILQYAILALLAVPLWAFCEWSLREGNPRLIVAAAHTGVALLVVGLWQGSYFGVGYLLAGESVLGPLRVAGLWYVLTACFQYGILLGGILFVQTSRRLRLQQEREAELRILAREAELRALKAQYHPQFFFNVLNSLDSLIESDPGRAQDLLDQVARLMRQTLESADDPSVPVEREMGSVKAYLEIERIRLGGRLEIAIGVEDDVREMEIPPLLLQPLVENAVKHGVTPGDGAGRVTVRARREGSCLVLTVGDSGPGPPGAGHEGDGHGLSMVRRRLEVLYGGEARLESRTLGGGGYEVGLRLPILPGGRQT